MTSITSSMSDETATRIPPSRPPLVLIASDQEWSTRSLESILWPHGYAVLRAYTGKKALERAQAAQPDLIIVDTSLPDYDSLELLATLRQDRRVRASTPILMTAPVRPSRVQRLAAFRAGAWEYLSYPLDAEELMLRLDGYMRAKFEADQARRDALLDEETGLYSIRGLERRARELGSHAYRNRWPLACVVVSPEKGDDEIGAPAASTQQMADALRNFFRISDAVGRLGDAEFAIIAPGTDADGAVQLSRRLRDAVKTRDLRIGYHAVTNYHDEPVEPMEMLARATIALRVSRKSGESTWIAPFLEEQI